MSDEIKLPSVTEVQEAIDALGEKITRLREDVSRLEIENRGWLEIWQRQQREIDELKADIQSRDVEIQALRNDLSQLLARFQSSQGES
jgi:SMC interacting uncharacterized protein involved in chromosome segregation